MNTTKATRLLSRQEVEARLFVSESTVRRLVRTGGLVAVKVGGQLRFREDDIETYLIGAQTGSAA